MSYVNNRLHIYDNIHCGDIVVSLSKGVTDPESEVGLYQATPQLVTVFDDAKELWISYPSPERAGDDYHDIVWDHLQQAQALAEYFLDAKDNHGWAVERLKPLLAGLIPWLKKWHNTLDPNLGMGLGDYFAGFLEERCRGFGCTVAEVRGVSQS